MRGAAGGAARAWRRVVREAEARAREGVRQRCSTRGERAARAARACVARQSRVSEIKVKHCGDCPARRWEDGHTVCGVDEMRRAVPGNRYGRVQPAPPDWCPAREGVTLRFERPSRLS